MQADNSTPTEVVAQVSPAVYKPEYFGRMDRHTFNTLRPQRPRKQTMEDIKPKVFREMRRRMLKDGVISKHEGPKFEYLFQYMLNESEVGQIKFGANTAGEARAQMKKYLGTRKLPRGVNIIGRKGLYADSYTIAGTDAGLAA